MLVNDASGKHLVTLVAHGVLYVIQKYVYIKKIRSTWRTMICDTAWIIRHELVYFGYFSVGLFLGGTIFGKCPKTENKPWAHFWCQRFLNKIWPFPENKPGAYSQ